jgi:hypothetical protein
MTGKCLPLAIIHSGVSCLLMIQQSYGRYEISLVQMGIPHPGELQFQEPRLVRRCGADDAGAESTG